MPAGGLDACAAAVVSKVEKDAMLAWTMMDDRGSCKAGDCGFRDIFCRPPIVVEALRMQPTLDRALFVLEIVQTDLNIPSRQSQPCPTPSFVPTATRRSRCPMR